MALFVKVKAKILRTVKSQAIKIHLQILLFRSIRKTAEAAKNTENPVFSSVNILLMTA